MAPPGLLESRYRLQERIAAGGLGEVWRAADLLLRRPVAVKLLHPGYAGCEEGLARFRAEARHAASLCHPAIAQVYDYCDADPPRPPYLVMELVDGLSLATILNAGPLGAARTMSIIGQAAAGLAAAHRAGLVHRDIKPGNLLVSKSGQVKVTDFGIAHAAGSAPITRTGLLMGTAGYLAPERAAGASATPASDLYALGIVAYQCLTGRLPFGGDPLAVALAHQLRPLPPLPATIPAEAAALVTGLTAKDPRDRPASAGHVAAHAGQLHAALTGPLAHRLSRPVPAGPGRRAAPPGRPPAAGPKPVAARPPESTRRRSGATIPAGLGLGLGTVAALGAAGWLAAGIAGPAAAHLHPGRAAASQQAGSHPSPHSKPVRMHDPSTAAIPAGPSAPPRTAAAPRRARGSTPPGRTATPVQASPSPAAGSSSPSPAPTPGDTPAPSATPSATGTPAASGAPTQAQG